MKLIKQISNLLFPSLILLFLTIMLRQAHKDVFTVQDSYIYGKGNAPEQVRSQVIQQLNQFQTGYSNRDTDQVDNFMQALFSQENLTVLGTMPDEIFIGQKEVSKLIYSDWNAWGDCTFLIDYAHISSNERVAWISTIGYVRFDLPRFLIMPLRLTAVMVNEGSNWKFQFLQFQFDLNLFFLFFTITLALLWLMVTLTTLLIKFGKRLIQANISNSSY